MIGVLKHALMITSFVLIMMLLIEYINVQTKGNWQLALRRSRFGQYVVGALRKLLIERRSNLAETIQKGWIKMRSPPLIQYLH